MKQNIFFIRLHAIVEIKTKMFLFSKKNPIPSVPNRCTWTCVAVLFNTVDAYTLYKHLKKKINYS